MKRGTTLLVVAILALVALAATLGFTRAGAGVQQSALSLQDQYVRVVKRVAPSVVQISTSSGLGSGIVLDKAGNIVTNAHVVGSDARFRVTLSSGKTYTGRLVGTFPTGDLAVIRVTASGLRPATLGQSKDLQIGDIVMAVGNPLGFRSSVTEGIVSGLGRTVPEGNGVTLPNTIQTSAAINHGNSGGALVDLAGHVIGIPTLGAPDPETGAAAAGIGFAIPSDIVRNISSQLIKSGKVTNSGRAYLGVSLGDTGNGALVGTVERGTGAAKAGIKAGDVIVSVAGKPTPSVSDLATVLAGLKPGDKVKVGLLRENGTRATVTVTLGTFPGS